MAPADADTQPPPPGTPVALVDDDGTVRLVAMPDKGGVAQVKGLGVLAYDVFAEAGLGGRLGLGRRSVHLLPPTPELVFRALARRAQVVRPQDAARIAHGCAVGPGSRVVEGGLGTGALTAYLAFLVGDEGRVHGFERRQDHLNVAQRNLEMAGLADRVAATLGDLADADVACDAFVADVPDPGSVVPAATRCLVPGGRACFYTPLVSQVEAVHRALARGPFLGVATLEVFERRWVVHDRGARPDFDMLGHTGFLTFATRVKAE